MSLIDDFYDQRSIMTKSQCAHIVGALWTVGTGANFLVFGLGFDRPLWSKANAQGHTLFVEQKPRWIRAARKAEPNLKAIKWAFDGWTVANSLPPSFERLYRTGVPVELSEREWDVILVDAPSGTKPHVTGRALPIYWARQYMADDGFVFVDDAKRELERTYCDLLFPTDEFQHRTLTRWPGSKSEMRLIRRVARTVAS